VVELAPRLVAAQPPPLPRGEVRELDGQIGQRRRPALRQGAVRLQHLADEAVEGPAVVHEVVLGVQHRRDAAGRRCCSELRMVAVELEN
jgi:hypothetical protein